MASRLTRRAQPADTCIRSKSMRQRCVLVAGGWALVVEQRRVAPMGTSRLCFSARGRRTPKLSQPLRRSLVVPPRRPSISDTLSPRLPFPRLFLCCISVCQRSLPHNRCNFAPPRANAPSTHPRGLPKHRNRDTKNNLRHAEHPTHPQASTSPLEPSCVFSGSKTKQNSST